MTMKLARRRDSTMIMGDLNTKVGKGKTNNSDGISLWEIEMGEVIDWYNYPTDAYTDGSPHKTQSST